MACLLICAPSLSFSQIQHEVNHQGILHRLCSDECFSRFRSSKRLSMSCCESCGNCTVTGNYHLVQIEDAVKKFCSPACICAYKQVGTADFALFCLFSVHFSADNCDCFNNQMSVLLHLYQRDLPLHFFAQVIVNVVASWIPCSHCRSPGSWAGH